MKLAITAVETASAEAPFVLRGPFAETIRQAAEIGYDAVEIHAPDPADLDVERIVQTCKASGVSISSIGTGLAYLHNGVSLTHQDEAARLDAIERIKAFIEIAAKLECLVIIGLIKGQVRNTEERSVFEERLTEAFEMCLPLAEKHGVTLALEAMNRYESDILNTMGECVQFIEHLGSKHLKLHIDTFHMNIEEDRIRESVVAAGRHIGHVHIADSNRRIPGSGHFDFSGFLNALTAVGYNGALAVECLGLPDPLGEARKAHGFLRELM